MARMLVRPDVEWAPTAKKTSGRFRGDGPPKALLHATITPSTSLPDYQNQSTAPHETLLWNRTTKRLTPVTHYYFNQYAKALQNQAGGVETNNDEVLQWELAGYLGKGTPKGQFDILEAPNVYWEQVADLLGPVVLSWGIKNKFSRSFEAGISESNKAKRMSGSEWDSFSGFCTHADVPENHHWDSPLGARVRLILQDKIWPTVIKPPVVTPPAITIPTGKSIDMYMFQCQPKGEPKPLPPVYVTNGTHYYWLETAEDRARITKEWTAIGIPTKVVITDSMRGHGVLVGPDYPPQPGQGE